MKILQVLKERQYFIIAIISAIAMLIFYPYAQSLGTLDIWFENVTSINLVLYIIFSVVFGLQISLFVNKLREAKRCGIKPIGSGFSGATLGLFVTACPSCLSIASLVLPLNAALFLTVFSTEFLLISIGLMVLSMYLLGGFRKV